MVDSDWWIDPPPCEAEFDIAASQRLGSTSSVVYEQKLELRELYILHVIQIFCERTI
ncbi:hypothetical protein ES702_00314 [subsurface metagenome]